MPRIRTFKPEFFRSPDTARASHTARLLFLAMWSWADDHGRGETNIYGLLGFAFPDSDAIASADFPRILAEIQSAWSVDFYTHRGRCYYAIPSWDKHQKNERRSSSKIPAPDDPESAPDLRFYGDAEMRGFSAQVRGDTAPGTGEQGNRGTDKESETRERASATANPSPHTPIPDDWAPNDIHRLKAKQLGIADLAAVADDFANHARAQGRTVASWDAAFSSWLAQPRTLTADRERQRAQAATGNAVTDKVAGWLAMGDQFTDPDAPKEIA